MTNEEILKNNIVRLISNSMQIHPWEGRQRVREQDLLIQIEYLTDKEMAETIKFFDISEKNEDNFDYYLHKLDKVLEAILIGIPIDEILEVIDNRITGKSIYTIIEEYRVKPFTNMMADLRVMRETK